MLYQVVWVRLAFAAFGIVAPVLSVVISVFMLGLASGSWAGGRMIESLAKSTRLSAIYFYAVAELVIGIGAFLVPRLFGIGESSLERLGEANTVSYLSFSAVAIALSVFPWCFAMGATFPLMMAYVREHRDADAKSFSHLYLANVLGASLGALVTAGILVEVLGFRHTLWVAGFFNIVIFIASLLLGLQSRRDDGAAPLPGVVPASPDSGHAVPWIRAILFTTGLASLAMEVVWTRAFAPVLGNQVYAFAALLVVYLVGTWSGSWGYRRDLAAARILPIGVLLAVVAIAALLPVVVNDPRVPVAGHLRALLALASIFPLCAALGYLTPRLIDDFSGGHPRSAGRAYAINVLGCILGPLIASYVLLPAIGAALSLVVLALPLFAFAYAYRRDLAVGWRRGATAAAVVMLLSASFVNVSYEDPCSWTARHCEVRRDYAATVVSVGEGRGKGMLVNGIGITSLTPITKFMAHLPLAFHEGKPESSLVICFGMGTTYRSLLSWGVTTTAVELVPSVRDAFPYYHSDAAAVLLNPRGRIVIDDGRRFLNRTRETYDVIVVDPPPPVEAAGSSLLYSKEFHRAVRDHLKPGGVFQTWFPEGEEGIARAVARSLADVFPYVRVYRSVEGWGVHYLASMQPLKSIGVDEMLSRMPVAAQSDLSEWTGRGLRPDIETVLSNELPIASVLTERRSIVVTDDRPYNEYFLVRRSIGAR